MCTHSLLFLFTLYINTKPFSYLAFVLVASAPSASSASSSGVASLLGKTIFRGNLTYVTYILGGCIILEGIYGTVLDGFWNSVNHGRTYKTVDWTKFKTEDDEE